MTNVIDITSLKQLKTIVEENDLVIGDFWAEWCGPCRALSPMIEQLADEFAGKVTVVKIDVDAQNEVAAAFRIVSIPTIKIWQKEFMTPETLVGLMPYNDLRDFVGARVTA